jgi:hypothetical protein
MNVSNTNSGYNSSITEILAQIFDYEDTSQAVVRTTVRVRPGATVTVDDKYKGSKSGYYTLLIKDTSPIGSPIGATGVFAAGSGSWDAVYTYNGAQLLVDPSPP